MLPRRLLRQLRLLPSPRKPRLRSIASGITKRVRPRLPRLRRLRPRLPPTLLPRSNAGAGYELRGKSGARLLLFWRRPKFLVRHFLQPRNPAARDVVLNPALVRRSAVPVDYARTCVGRFSRFQLDHRTALDLRVGDAFFDQDDLAAFVAVPLGARARIEAEMGDSGLGSLIQLGDVAASEVRVLFLLRVQEPQPRKRD